MRDLPGTNGKCPVRDTGPFLSTENRLAVELYSAAKLAGEVREISINTMSYKSLVYLKPAEVEALMRIYAVPRKDRPLLWMKLRALQEVDHEVTQARSKKS